MGILSYFGKPTYTLFKVYASGQFMDRFNQENPFRLEYQAMYLHEDKYKGWGEDYEDLPNREFIKRGTDKLALIKIANQFNNLQEKNLDDRVSLRIHPENLLGSGSDFPFPIYLEDLS